VASAADLSVVGFVGTRTALRFIMWTRFRWVSLLIALHGIIAACSSGTPASPTPLLDASAAVTPPSASALSSAVPDTPLFRSYTVQFSDLGPDRSAVTTSTEAGFTISTALANWIAFGYGNPGPSLVFEAPAGPPISGEVTIRTHEDLSLFRFTSVDLYSSVTPIPYVFTGILRGHTMFTESGTLGNTFGNFVRVSSSHSNLPIDTLVIRLTNGTTCCTNPMGLDNFVTRR
jgi:hypothetical protein